MRSDITNIEDIKQLVDTFYSKVNKDERLGYIFNTIAQIDWEEHLPNMYNFWESILFGGTAFKGHVMQKHIQLNRKEPLSSGDFDRWLQLWGETVDQLFSGPLADEAKKRASHIRTLMFYKINKGPGLHPGTVGS